MAVIARSTFSCVSALYWSALDFAAVTWSSVFDFKSDFSCELQSVSKLTEFSISEYALTRAIFDSERLAVRSRRVWNIAPALVQSVGGASGVVTPCLFCLLVLN